tara:strand:+ start:382 stop:1569 length:1188 start_codon:yes stop_codon:yes gene_type:complete
MKIAIIGEQNTKGGGSYHQSLKTYKLLSSIEEFKFCFLNINSKITSKEKNNLSINYNINLVDRLFFLFNSSKIFKSLLKKFKIQNKFEIFIKKEKIDLILFLGCSRLADFCDKINYVTYVYEFHHIFRPDLPEYKEWTDFDFRESLLNTSIRKSISLIVDTKKKKEDIVKYYNCHEKKIEIIPLSSNIVVSNKEDAKFNSEQIINWIGESKEYFFYPAQYWSHKNHYYILLAIKTLNEKYNKKTKFVFTGHKKNNFNYIKKKIMDLNLNDQVICLDYLNNDEIRNLYKNCKALVMPSLVGYSSLPLYEAFYYKKPVFYTKDLLDTSLKGFVSEIDIENPASLAEQIINFDKNIQKIEEKTTIANQYFIKNLSDEKIRSNYIGLFKKLQNLIKLYK